MFNKSLGKRLGKRIQSGLPAYLRNKFLYLWTGRYDDNNLLNNLGNDVITSSFKDWHTSYIPPYNGIKYGLLYNMYAVSDIRNIANTGWHVPSFEEYYTMINYLGGEVDSSYKVKDTSETYWRTGAFISTNEAGFNLVGNGMRIITGEFLYLQERTILGCTDYTKLFSLYYNVPEFTYYDNFYRTTGVALRLVKDTTTLLDGQTSTYTGNDGKIYETICIGTQEWISCNLYETKYRDGSDIVEVSDNIQWYNLTSGAMCAFNNDWLNVGSFSPPTFSVPDNASFLAADGSDDFWFNSSNVLQQKTHLNLIESTTARTFVNYEDEDPHNIHGIGILKDGETLSDAEKIILTKYFKLWVQYWSATMMEVGHLKTNRTLIED